MISLLTKGGPVIIPLILLSIFALAIVLEKLWRLWRLRSNMDVFAEKVYSLVEQGDFHPALNECSNYKHPLSEIFETALLNRSQDSKELERMVEKTGSDMVEGLESRLGALATIVGVAPMMGFLGTIIGLIRAFMAWEKLGEEITVNALAGGIYEAMITTAVGLSIAIPNYMLYNYLVSVVQTISKQMSGYADDLLHFLTNANQKDRNEREALKDEV